MMNYAEYLAYADQALRSVKPTASSRAARIHCSSCTARMLDTVSVISVAM